MQSVVNEDTMKKLGDSPWKPRVPGPGLSASTFTWEGAVWGEEEEEGVGSDQGEGPGHEPEAEPHGVGQEVLVGEQLRLFRLRELPQVGVGPVRRAGVTGTISDRTGRNVRDTHSDRGGMEGLPPLRHYFRQSYTSGPVLDDDLSSSSQMRKRKNSWKMTEKTRAKASSSWERLKLPCAFNDFSQDPISAV